MGEQSNIYKEIAAAFFSISILPKIVWAMWSCSMSVLVNFKLCFPFFHCNSQTVNWQMWSSVRNKKHCHGSSTSKNNLLKSCWSILVCIGHIQKREYNWIPFESNVADWRKRLTIASITLYLLQWEHRNCGTPFSLSSQFNKQTITCIVWMKWESLFLPFAHTQGH